MNLTPEQQEELAHFPEVLRALVEAEVAAGNAIEEIGHSFPAPPVGAYVKLAKKVVTRARASAGGVDFYERNCSSYSGEFTDTHRFFFVLEPANPPPPEPDMDAIRAAMQGPRDELTRLAEREPETSATSFMRLRDRLIPRKSKPPRADLPKAAGTGTTVVTEGYKVLQASTETSAAWLLHFRDVRPPQEIQFQLERDLMSLMPPRMEAGKLVCRTHLKKTGISYQCVLRYEAALLDTHCYSVRVDASWADAAATHRDYFRKNSASWFELWTRQFQRAGLPSIDAGSPGRYQQFCAAALAAESQLSSVEAIQQSILEAMRHGGSFATAHKEGGTTICWQNGHFLRSDYGESEEREEFSDPARILKFLRQFYDWETSSNVYPAKVSEFEAWKLILRLLRKK